MNTESKFHGEAWLKSLISGTRRAVLPVLTGPGIPLIGAPPMEVFRSGELQFQAIMALKEALDAESLKMEAALTMMDLSVEAEAFGANILFSEAENPTVVGPAVVQDEADVERLAVPEVGTARTKQCLLAAKLCASEITDRPTLGGMIGPFSLAGRLLEMSNLMLQTAMAPEMVHALLEKVTQFLVGYAKGFKEAGCNGILMAEPAAGLISPAMCQEFSSDYVRRVVDAVKDEHFVFVLHNCGKTEKMVGQMRSTDADALHVGNAVDICAILRQVPEDFPVMGNIDPAGVLRMETPENVFAATKALLERTREFPNHVLSSGCDMPLDTPMENVKMFFRAGLE